MNALKKKLIYFAARRYVKRALQSKAGFIGAGMALGALAGAVAWMTRQ